MAGIPDFCGRYFSLIILQPYSSYMKRVAGFMLLFLSAVSHAQNTRSLLVSATFPKFLRNGDHLQIPVVIKTNLSLDLSGQANLQLTDATRKTSVDGWFNNVFPVQYFTSSFQSPAKLHFLLTVPDSFRTSLQMSIVCTSGLMSDTLQKLLPIVYYDHALIAPVRDFDVSKTIYKKSGGALVAPGGSADVYTGDTLVVKLMIRAAKTASGIVLTDALAATMKPVRPTGPGKFSETSVVVPISNLEMGRHVYSYLVIAEHAGRFSFAPVTVKAGKEIESFDPGFILRVEAKP